MAHGDVFFPEAPSGPAVQWVRGSDWAALDDSESSGDEEDAEGWEVLTSEAVRTLSPRQQRTWQQPASRQRLTVRRPRLMRLAASCRTCILHCSAPAHHADASGTEEMPHLLMPRPPHQVVSFPRCLWSHRALCIRKIIMSIRKHSP